MDRETLATQMAAALGVGDGQRMVIQQFDASVVVDILLDGFTSVASTVAIAMGLDDKAADEMADTVVKAIMDDPAAMELVRGEVLGRMRGIDEGPHTLRIHTKDGK